MDAIQFFGKIFLTPASTTYSPHHQKHYFVFIDDESTIKQQSNEWVHIIYQKKLGWSYDTLYRFRFFLSIEDKHKDMDYLYFFNANTLFVQEIGDEIIPFEQGLMGVIHPRWKDSAPCDFTYDRNPRSKAYIPHGSGEHYFMGGMMVVPIFI